MARRKFKYGVYEERARPTCDKCKLKHPECKHIAPPKRVVALKGPTEIWMELNGTNYPAVLFRAFNDFTVVGRVMTDTQFFSRYTYVGRYVTEITRTERMAK